jgi:hypothetical protein
MFAIHCSGGPARVRLVWASLVLGIASAVISEPTDELLDHAIDYCRPPRLLHLHLLMILDVESPRYLNIEALPEQHKTALRDLETAA